MTALLQNTTEWIEMRKTKIGASDAPVIMGVSPYKTEYQLWEEKLGLRSPNINQAMQRGTDLEETARKSFEQKTGIIVFPQVIFHSHYEWMMASLDGMDIEQKHIVELKCPGKEDHAVALDGEIPEKYYPQLQHQLEVSGLDMAYYYSFDGNDGVVLECRRNTKYIQQMVESEKEFYKCVRDVLPPKLNESRDFDIKEDEFWSACAIEWLDLQKNLMQYEKRDRELRDMLVSMCRGQNSLGAGVRVSKMVRKGNIDYSAIPELQGIDLDRYRKDPIECWRIVRA